MADTQIDAPRPKQIDTYEIWEKAQNVPVITGFHVDDVKDIEVAPWDQKGGLGAIVRLDGTGDIDVAYISVIPPKQSLNVQKHLYEEVVLVVKGHGTTEVWQKDGKKHSFEWKEGSFFSIPVNAYYRHFNLSGKEPARLLGMNNAPFVMNLFHNLDFVFNTDFVFTDRFNPGEDDYFSKTGERIGPTGLTTNFVPDLNTMQLPYRETGRGGVKGSLHVRLNMSGGTFGPHITTIPEGSYYPGHFHGPGAHLYILQGTGFDLLWYGNGERKRVDFKPGSLFVPPDRWFHQHFNTGKGEVRQLAVKTWGAQRKSVMNMAGYDSTIYYDATKIETGSPARSIKQGGTQIDFRDEDPSLHQMYHEELAKTGVTCAMASYHPFCSLHGAAIAKKA
jgi:gentisate 1,2-dioxygenase